jgi:hypothetical protein
MTDTQALIKALHAVFTSPNVADSNGEIANLVDTSDGVARGLFRIAKALENIADIMEERWNPPPPPAPADDLDEEIPF